jgi:hypothetical protein
MRTPRFSKAGRTGLVLIVALGSVGPLSAQPAPAVRTLTEQEMTDMMVGSSIQASRSSDSAAMIKRVKDAMAEGRRFTLLSIDDLPDDWTVVVPSGVGGGGAWDYVRDRVQKQNLPTIPNATVAAIGALSKYLGKTFQAVVRTEAAAATLSAFMAASELGLPVVDACPAGRAVPEMAQQTPFLAGILGSPAAMVTRWGDTILVEKAVDDYRLEDLSRVVAVASGGSVQVAHTAISGRDVKRTMIHGSISQAILFGRTVREARAQGKDPVAELLRVSNGYRLFRGVVTKAESKGEFGFTWWNVELQGTGADEGHVYKVFVKNENIVAWRDGTPDAMSPDLISNLDPQTGDAIAGQGLGGYPMGMDVVMVGIPNSSLWRAAKGVEVMGPRHFGFDFDYVPIEQLQQRRK